MTTTSDDSAYVVVARPAYYLFPLGGASTWLWGFSVCCCVPPPFIISAARQGDPPDVIGWIEVAVCVVFILVTLMINVWWGCGYVRRRRLIIERGQATMVYANGHRKVIQAKNVSYCSAGIGSTSSLPAMPNWITLRTDLAFYPVMTGEYRFPWRLPGAGMRSTDIVEAARRFNDLNDLHVAVPHGMDAIMKEMRAERAQFLAMRAARRAEQKAARAAGQTHPG